MTHVCEELGNEYGVTYNHQMSVNMFIKHSRDDILPDLTLDGQPIKWLKREKHLENILQCGLKETDDII